MCAQRDLADLAVLDLRRLQYLPSPNVDCGRGNPSPERRSGHTAHLLPADGRLSLLVLGGRDYRPPVQPWQDGEHFGRDDAHRLLLGGVPPSDSVAVA